MTSKNAEGFNHVTGQKHEGLGRAWQTASKRNICVMGGANVKQQYLKASLVDELHLHIGNSFLGNPFATLTLNLNQKNFFIAPPPTGFG